MVKAIINTMIGIIIGGVSIHVMDSRKSTRTIETLKDTNVKFNEFYDILLQWIRVYQNGHTLTDYFLKHNYKTVAIYGMKELGKALLAELNNSEIEVKYCIDKDAANIYVPIDVFTPDEELEKVDVIVIAAVHYYTEIEPIMRDKMGCDVVAIDDVVYEADK